MVEAKLCRECSFRSGCMSWGRRRTAKDQAVTAEADDEASSARGSWMRQIGGWLIERMACATGSTCQRSDGSSWSKIQSMSNRDRWVRWRGRACG